MPVKRYYVTRSHYFDSHPYNTKNIANAVKRGGGTNVRTGKQFGWSNQPQVVTFSADSRKVDSILRAVKQSVHTMYIIIREKDW